MKEKGNEKENQKENQKEDTLLFRTTISYVNSKRNNDNKNKDNKSHKLRSCSLDNNQLLQKFIPTLKPIGTNIDPSPINLFGNEEIIIDDTNFTIEPKEQLTKVSLLNKRKSVKNEEIELNDIKSGDDEYSKKLSNIYSDSSDNESKDIENKLNKNYDKKNSNIMKIKNNVNYCINQIRRKMDRIKSKIKLTKFNDDSNVSKISCTKYFDENYRLKCAQKFINKLKFEKMKECEKYKNKTISFKDLNSYKPPILGFLQMYEVSVNSTLSSSNLSEI